MVPRASREVWKSRKVAQELMKVRKEKIIHETNIANFQVIGSNSSGTFPSLIVNSEGNSYLFNCGEGTQRICFANKVKLVNLRHIFVTNHSWDRVSGIYGLTLCAQEAGVPSMTVYSNDKIENFFKATHSFINYIAPNDLLAKSCFDASKYEDHGISVEMIPINSTSTSLKFLSDTLAGVKRQKTQANLIAYACTLPDISGPLDANKCKELKVPIGPLLAKLKGGQDITLPDGRTIKSAEVCGPKSLGLKFIVIECPTVEDIDAILDNPRMNELRRDRKSDDKRQVEVVIHFSPQSVIDDSKYRNWMTGFEQTCQHLFISHDNIRSINLIDSYRLQYLLNHIDEELFPTNNLPEKIAQLIKLELSSQTKEDNPPMVISRKYPDVQNNIIELSCNDRLHIRPHAYYEINNSPVDVEHNLNEVKESIYFSDELNKLKELREKMPKSKDHEPELVFLGTVSASPSKYRNSSGILLNFKSPHKASVLLDCGEDTYGQMLRYYGPEKIKEVLKRLKLIYISHHHADHHMGLITILKNRRKLIDTPVPIILPPNLDRFLDFYNESFENIKDSYEVHSIVGLKTFPNIGVMSTDSEKLIKSDLIEKTNNLLDDIKVVAVDHCVNSCATVMKFKIGHPELDTYTVAYSGDARPSQEFIIAGKGCDLLIHEATLDHHSLELAKEKKHSTTTECIEVSRCMEAKFTIMTHFSQRYSKIPPITSEFDDKIGFAFDYMTIKCPSQLGRLPLMKSILAKIFKSDIEANDEKYYRSELKRKQLDNLLRELD